MAEPVILVVDDDKFIRVAIGEALAGGGYRLVEAEDGDAALARLDEVEPALVILDLLMPRRSGLDTLAELRKRHPAVPVLVVTSLDTESTAEEAKRLGATHFIGKPFHPLELNTAVRKLTQRPPGVRS